jgi:hypothetical protein
MERSSTAHTGAASCLICATPPDTPFCSLDVVSSIGVQAGDYYAEAWLRAPDGATATGATGVQVLFHPADGSPAAYQQGNQVVPGTTWQSSAVGFTLPQGGQVEVFVHSYEPGGGCVLIDDVGFYKR